MGQAIWDIFIFRPYTWDKQFETVGKQLATMAIVTGVLPTVISPSEYQDRFCQAMMTFFASTFPMVPSSNSLIPSLTLQHPISFPISLPNIETDNPDNYDGDLSTSEELRLCKRVLNEAFQLQQQLDQW